MTERSDASETPFWALRPFGPHSRAAVTTPRPSACGCGFAVGPPGQSFVTGVQRLQASPASDESLHIRERKLAPPPITQIARISTTRNNPGLPRPEARLTPASSTATTPRSASACAGPAPATSTAAEPGAGPASRASPAFIRSLARARSLALWLSLSLARAEAQVRALFLAFARSLVLFLHQIICLS